MIVTINVMLRNDRDNDHDVVIKIAKFLLRNCHGSGHDTTVVMKIPFFDVQL